MALNTNPVDINRRTTGLTLTPEMSGEIIAKAVEQSAVMRLAERIALPGNGLSIPVITGEPTADWVAETAEKPVSEHTFGTKTMTPYKLAVIELFSNEFRRDFRALYDELARRLPFALARKFDETVFHGTAPGTGFDVISGATAKDIETTPYGSIVDAYGAIATAGYRPTGFALSPAAEVILFSAVGQDQRPIFLPSVADGSVGAILGVPVTKANSTYATGNPATVGFVGDWSQAKWGMVNDISVSVSEEATINTGTETVNLWQRNMFAIRAEVEVGHIVNAANAFVKLTGATSA